MPHSRLFAALLTAGALAAGCHGDTADTVTGPPPPPAPAMNVGGAWTGTIRDLGATDEYFCPGQATDIAIDVSQAGEAVTFRLPLSGCSHGGRADFQGTLAGTSLRGDLTRGAATLCALTGGLHGQIDGSAMVLDGSLHGDCNAVRLHVELHR